MKTRKAWLAILVTLTATLVLTGCGDSSGTGTKASSQKSQNGVSVDTLKTIKDRGTLIVGVKFDTAPFGFIPEGQSTPAGFDIDLAKEFAKQIGVKSEFVQVTTKNRIPNLDTGKIDMIMASMLKTPEREKAIDFSKVYFSDEQTLLVPNDSPIKSVKDLGGKTVALAQGGAEEENLRKVAPPSVKVIAYQSWPQALQAMIRGEAQAVSSTVGLLSGLQESAKAANVSVKTVGGGFADGPVGAGFRKGDDDLRKAFNKALVDMVKDGTYNTISNKWWRNVRSAPYKVDLSSSDQ